MKEKEQSVCIDEARAAFWECSGFTIRKAAEADLTEILNIYAYARDFMVRTGNPKQWAEKGYPAQTLLEEDIAKGELYVMEKANSICGVFAFPVGPDPTYEVIREGAWITDSKSYGTIHRIAGNGRVHGLLEACVEFGFSLTDVIRIDTHEDNLVMQKLIKRSGFTYCGIINAADGTPRLAYEKAYSR